MTIYEAYVHIQVKDEVSLTNYMDSRVKKEKSTKMSPIGKLSQID